MASYPPDLPSDAKSPQYSPYPAPQYPAAPGYQYSSGPGSPLGTQQFSEPSSAGQPSAPSGPPTVSSHVQNEEATEQRRLSAESYDDVFRLSKPVEVTFQEVFREAKGSESPEAIFKINTTVFTYTSRGLYIFLSVVLGIILSIVWGILFGAVNFVVTWLFQPALKMSFILLRIAANAFGPVLHIFLDPLFQSWGYVFSKIRGAFNFNVNGLMWPKKENRRALTEEA
ncbi:caveolin-1-like [Amphiura filiformis]|uniref:caveolin-1-like n=1 Tax=Amphiura filiformis TaxID=82378 RepID=UPI003B227F48